MIKTSIVFRGAGIISNFCMILMITKLLTPEGSAKWVIMYSWSLISASIFELGYTPFILRQKRYFKEKSGKLESLLLMMVVLSLAAIWGSYDLLIVIFLGALVSMSRILCADLRVNEYLRWQQALDWVVPQLLFIIVYVFVCSYFVGYEVALYVNCLSYFITLMVSFFVLKRKNLRVNFLSRSFNKLVLVERLKLTCQHMFSRNVNDLKLLIFSNFISGYAIATYKVLNQIFETMLFPRMAIINKEMLNYSKEVSSEVRHNAISRTTKLSLLLYLPMSFAVFVVAILIEHFDFEKLFNINFHFDIYTMALFVIVKLVVVLYGPVVPVLVMNNKEMHVIVIQSMFLILLYLISLVAGGGTIESLLICELISYSFVYYWGYKLRKSIT